MKHLAWSGVAAILMTLTPVSSALADEAPVAQHRESTVLSDLVAAHNAEHGLSRWMELTSVREVDYNHVVAIADSCAGRFYFTIARDCSRSSWRIVSVGRTDPG